MESVFSLATKHFCSVEGAQYTDNETQTEPSTEEGTKETTSEQRNVETFHELVIRFVTAMHRIDLHCIDGDSRNKSDDDNSSRSGGVRAYDGYGASCGEFGDYVWSMCCGGVDASSSTDTTFGACTGKDLLGEASVLLLQTLYRTWENVKATYESKKKKNNTSSVCVSVQGGDASTLSHEASFCTSSGARRKTRRTKKDSAGMRDEGGTMLNASVSKREDVLRVAREIQQRRASPIHVAKPLHHAPSSMRGKRVGASPSGAGFPSCPIDDTAHIIERWVHACLSEEHDFASSQGRHGGNEGPSSDVETDGCDDAPTHEAAVSPSSRSLLSASAISPTYDESDDAYEEHDEVRDDVAYNLENLEKSRRSKAGSLRPRGTVRSGEHAKPNRSSIPTREQLTTNRWKRALLRFQELWGRYRPIQGGPAVAAVANVDDSSSFHVTHSGGEERGATMCASGGSTTVTSALSPLASGKPLRKGTPAQPYYPMGGALSTVNLVDPPPRDLAPAFAASSTKRVVGNLSDPRFWSTASGITCLATRARHRATELQVSGQARLPIPAVTSLRGGSNGMSSGGAAVPRAVQPIASAHPHRTATTTSPLKWRTGGADGPSALLHHSSSPLAFEDYVARVKQTKKGLAVIQ